MDVTKINADQRVFSLNESIIPESVSPARFKAETVFANHGKFIARTSWGLWCCVYISNRGVRGSDVNFLHLTFSEKDEVVGENFTAPMIFAGNMDLPGMNIRSDGKITNACLLVDERNRINLFFSDDSGIRNYIADATNGAPANFAEWREVVEGFIPESELGDVAMSPTGEIVVFGIANGRLFEKVVGKRKFVIAEDDCRRPSAFITSEGVRHIAFERNRRVYYASWREGAKEISDELVAYFCSSWPSIAVDAHGEVVIAYQGEGKVNLKRNPDLYDKLRPGGGSTVSFAVRRKNGEWNIHDHLRSKEILLKRRVSSSVPEEITSPIFKNHMEEFWHPTLCVDLHGIIWMFFINTTRRHIYFTRFTGEEFGDFHEAVGAIDCPTPQFHISKNSFGRNRIGIMFHAANRVYMDSIEVPEYKSSESRRILFLDNMELDRMEGVETCLGIWEKSPLPLRFSGGSTENPSENFLTWVNVEKTDTGFNMRYMGYAGKTKSNWMPGRAFSEDGVRWVFKEPFDMSRLSLNGKPFPNYFWRPVFVEDPNEANENFRFKGLLEMHQHVDGLEQRVWRSATSPDSLNWHLVQDAEIVVSGDISVNSHIIIDNEDGNPERRFKIMQLMGCHAGRAAVMYTSPDGINWKGATWLRVDPDNIASPCSPYPTGQIIIDPDGAENPWEEEVHDAVVWKENGFLMNHYDAFYCHFNQHTNKALAVSRDGRHFWRVKRGGINMPHGNAGEWDSGRDRTGLPVRVGDELWLYYCGMPASYFADPDAVNLEADAWNHPENADELRPWQVGLAKLRVDGWVSAQLKRECENGMILTIPFKYTGGRLVVNGKGLDKVRVEIVDSETCDAMAGFEKEKSSFEVDDSISASASWNGVMEPPEGDYRIKFFLDSLSTSLYSFGFKQIKE